MIKIYSSDDPSSLLDTTDANSLLISNNRRSFDPKIRKLYFRNDDSNIWISNMSLQATSTGIDLVNGTNGFGFKFYKGNLEPTERVWQNIDYNYPIIVNNIGTSAAPDTSFYPFWMRVEVSPNIDISLYQANLISSFIIHST